MNGSDPFLVARKALVDSLRGVVTDQRVLDALARVARERFVTADDASRAYVDRPLPIGHGQTISQPRMVAIMLQEARLTGAERVLEVGAGSGYQAALLTLLAREVIAVELIPALAEGAAQVLAALGCTNARVEVAGEALGWPAAAPYDAIIVAAAAARIPQSLIDQLAPGGRLVIPVGPRRGQDLMVVESRPEGLVVQRKGPCRFVPLLGRDGYAEGDAGNLN